MGTSSIHDGFPIVMFDYRRVSSFIFSSTLADWNLFAESQLPDATVKSWQSDLMNQQT